MVETDLNEFTWLPPTLLGRKYPENKTFKICHFWVVLPFRENGLVFQTYLTASKRVGPNLKLWR